MLQPTNHVEHNSQRGKTDVRWFSQRLQPTRVMLFYMVEHQWIIGPFTRNPAGNPVLHHWPYPWDPLGFSANFIQKNRRWQVNFSWFHWVNIWFWYVFQFFPCFLGRHQTSALWKKERSPDRLGRRGFASWAIWSWTFGTAEARCQHVIFSRCP